MRACVWCAHCTLLSGDLMLVATRRVWAGPDAPCFVVLIFAWHIRHRHATTAHIAGPSPATSDVAPQQCVCPSPGMQGYALQTLAKRWVARQSWHPTSQSYVTMWVAWLPQPPFLPSLPFPFPFPL